MNELTTARAESPGGPAWKHYLLVAAIAAVVVFWQLGVSVMEDHECKLALTARTMAEEDPHPWILESGAEYKVPPHTPLNRWMVPVENGRPRLVKTPLPYWVGAVVMELGDKGSWGPRLPSAACAVLLALVTLAMGRRMMSPRAALMGAVMLATCVGVQKWGRDARPEMMLCLWMTVAMGCSYRGMESKRLAGHVGWMAAFWIAMGLANLSKEFVPLLLAWPVLGYTFWRGSYLKAGDEGSLRLLRIFLIVSGVGLAVHLSISAFPSLRWWTHTGIEAGRGYNLTMAAALGGPMVWYFFATRAWGALGRLLPTAIPGLAVMAGMFVPWMIYMTKLFPGFAEGVFASQVTERAAGTGQWVLDNRVHIYLLSLVTMSLPWAAFVPGAFAVAFMRRFGEHRRGLVFLLLWSVGVVGLFTAAAAKREHYILPMLPAFCLLMGFAAEDVIFNHKWVAERMSRLLGGGHGLVAIVLVIVAGVLAVSGRVFLTWGQGWAIAGMTLAAALPMIAAGAWAMKGKLRPLVPMVAASMLIFYLAYWGTIGLWDERRPYYDFAVEVAQTVPPEEELFSWGEPRAKMVYHVGRVVPAFQWRFEGDYPILAGEDPNLWIARIDRLCAEDLRKNPGIAKWMIGYAPDKELLSTLGYEPVLEKQDLRDRKLVFVLFKRTAPAATTDPAAASP